MNSEIYPEIEKTSYKVETIQGDSVGVINFTISKKGDFITFIQDFPYSEVKMNKNTLKPVSSVLRIMLQTGPFEIQSKFEKDKILLKAKTATFEKDTVIEMKKDYYHSDFIFMLARAFPFIDGKTYEIKSFVPMRGEIFPVKIEYIGKKEIEVNKKKIKGYQIVFDFGTEKHEGYYEEKEPHRLLFYTNGRYNIILKE